MSSRIAARLAGALFLFVMVSVLVASALQGETGDAGEALRAISERTLPYRASIVALLVAAVASLALGVTLYAVTRRQDENLAMLALVCRVAEAGPYVVQIVGALALLSLSGSPGATELALAVLAADAVSWGVNIGATFFAVSSAVFAYLLLRARAIPMFLSVTGLVASLILVVAIPMETAAGVTTAEGASMLLWLPMFVFEIGAGFWLLLKGVRPARTTPGEVPNPL
ncbi:DUF4386 domain-containing protein [Myceligenerans halotolerans]